MMQSQDAGKFKLSFAVRIEEFIINWKLKVLGIKKMEHCQTPSVYIGRDILP